MLSETRERFAKAIVAKVPVERIVEIHFFHPIRQGGVESGVAVVAATPADQGVRSLENRSDEGAIAPAESDTDIERPVEDATIEAAADLSTIGEEQVEQVEQVEEQVKGQAEEQAEEQAEALAPEVSSPADIQTEEPAHERLTVFTARYRLVLKGPDRGKWEANVVAEADAPLPTVDAVVRGVLRRAGDAEDAERMAGEQLAAELERVQA